MLVKLIRPFLTSGWNTTKLVCSQNLSTSNVFFQQSFSGTNSGASSKPTDKAPNLKNQQRSNICILFVSSLETNTKFKINIYFD